MSAVELLKQATLALNKKKGVDLTAVRVGDLTVLTEYFLIAHGTSSTHVRALAEEVEDRLEQQGVRPNAVEGRATGWILLDYGTVVVHVFTKEVRDTYSLERLWSDGETVDLTEWISQEEEEQ